jgi:hypothetical protein
MSSTGCGRIICLSGSWRACCRSSPSWSPRARRSRGAICWSARASCEGVKATSAVILAVWCTGTGLPCRRLCASSSTISSSTVTCRVASTAICSLRPRLWFPCRGSATVNARSGRPRPSGCPSGRTPSGSATTICTSHWCSSARPICWDTRGRRTAKACTSCTRGRSSTSTKAPQVHRLPSNRTR